MEIKQYIIDYLDFASAVCLVQAYDLELGLLDDLAAQCLQWAKDEWVLDNPVIDLIKRRVPVQLFRQVIQMFDLPDGLDTLTTLLPMWHGSPDTRPSSGHWRRRLEKQLATIKHPYFIRGPSRTGPLPTVDTCLPIFWAILIEGVDGDYAAALHSTTAANMKPLPTQHQISAFPLLKEAQEDWENTYTLWWNNIGVWEYQFYKRFAPPLLLDVQPLIGDILHIAIRGHHFDQALNLINDDASVQVNRAAFFLAAAHNAVALMERILGLLDGSVTRQRLLDEALLLLVTHGEKHCSCAFRGSPDAFWYLVDHGAQVEVLAKYVDQYGLLQSIGFHLLYVTWNANTGYIYRSGAKYGHLTGRYTHTQGTTDPPQP
ncbi:hypothetical protein F5Y10DRAFT_293253 [Nemania abortiva]|nr:hypothetical protein F5Y10DRAFT_293253 [Nemania abortiva]